ncbi:cytochrome c3 family protein [bacterium]|nr:cytochrome c3 family protein [bacterium]
MHDIRKYLVTLVKIMAIFMLWGSSWAQESFQPVQFNHDYHLGDLGLTCLDCHKNAKHQERASIPNIDICSECHEDEFDNVEADKVFEYISFETAIPWKRVHRVPDHAYFSHRRHVQLGEIDCIVCHGDVEQMAAPFERPFVNMDMNWCLDCHEKSQISDECSDCHR